MDLEGINFSDLKHRVMILCVNTTTQFVQVHTVLRIRT